MKFSKLIPRVDGGSNLATIYDGPKSYTFSASRTNGFYVQNYLEDMYGTYFMDMTGQVSKLVSIYHDELSSPKCGPDNKIYMSCPTTSTWDWPFGGALFSYEVGAANANLICGSLSEVVTSPVYGVDGRSTRFISLGYDGILGVTKDGMIWVADGDLEGSGFSIVRISPEGYSHRVLYYPTPDPDVVNYVMGTVSPNGHDVYVGLTEMNFSTMIYHCSIHRVANGALHYVASINETYPNPFFGELKVTMSGQITAICTVYDMNGPSSFNTAWSVSPNGTKSFIAATDNVGNNYFTSDIWGNVYLRDE